MGRSTLSFHGEDAQTIKACEKTVVVPASNFRTTKKRAWETSSDSSSESVQNLRTLKTPKRAKTAVAKVSPTTTKSTTVDIAVWAKAYRKAFPTFLFYFDQIEESIKRQLKYQIRRLGGRIEPFFSSKITHLITCQNKPNELRYAGSGKSSRALSLSSPASKLSNVAAASELTQKASKWGIKVWTTQKLFNVLRHLLKSPMNSLSQPSKPLNDVLRDEKVFGISTHSSLSTSSSHIHYLKQIYLLVEDTTKVHRPIAVREYSVNNGGGSVPWPKVYRSTEGRCPFIKYEDDLKSSKALQVSSKPLNSTNVGGPQSRTPVSTIPKTNSLMVIPKKSGYCENCQAKFANLEEHVLSPIHSQYASDQSSYVELDAVLESVSRKVLPRTQEMTTGFSEDTSSSSPVSTPTYVNEEYNNFYQPSKRAGDQSDEGYISLKTISESDPNENMNLSTQTTTQYNDRIEMNESLQIFGDYNETKSKDTPDLSQPSYVPQYLPLPEETLITDANIHSLTNIECEQNFPPETYDTSERPALGYFDSTQLVQPATNYYTNQLFHYAQADDQLSQVPTQDEIYAAIRDFQQFVQGPQENAYPNPIPTQNFCSFDANPIFDPLVAGHSVHSLQEDYQPIVQPVTSSLSYDTANTIPNNIVLPKPNQRMSVQELFLTDISYFLNNEHPTTSLTEAWLPNNHDGYVSNEFYVP